MAAGGIVRAGAVVQAQVVRLRLMLDVEAPVMLYMVATTARLAALNGRQE